jgi:hypothetical protein
MICTRSQLRNEPLAMNSTARLASRYSKFLRRKDKENFRVAINCERVHFHFREPPFLAKNSAVGHRVT